MTKEEIINRIAGVIERCGNLSTEKMLFCLDAIIAHIDKETYLFHEYFFKDKIMSESHTFYQGIIKKTERYIDLDIPVLEQIMHMVESYEANK